MLPLSNIHFLQEKIQDLRSALFFCMSDSVLKLPTTIVTALKVDDVGQIWFFLNRPIQQLQEFDKEFPSRLEFFKKGKSFYMKMSGKAIIVNDPEEVNSLVSLPDDIRTAAMGQMILVKFKIYCADYYEQDEQKDKSLWHQLKSKVMKWVYNENLSLRPHRLEPSYSS
ncbi:MAG: pyridoxamine 5'-phosphate oxidase family protein [Flavitalea sp.]